MRRRARDADGAEFGDALSRRISPLSFPQEIFFIIIL
jgi:hypothetical protein